MRETWKSKIGFIWAAIGSAVGLGSIWRFPYVAGQNGGGAFVLLFIIFLLAVSLPTLMTEIIIGRKGQLDPSGAFRKLGKRAIWGKVGYGTVLTGFLVSSFYSVICGWTLGYLIQSFWGGLSHLQTMGESKAHFDLLLQSPYWAMGTHLGFMAIATTILYVGVQKGIETGNKIFVPMLFFILLILAIKGLTMPSAKEGLSFLFSFKFKDITSEVVLMALGQAFFGLSIGQGTMVTYGSYLKGRESIPYLTLFVALAVILVSLLAGIAIFTTIFSVGAEPSGGPDLLFQTLPIVLGGLPGGYFLTILFFSLIFLAGLTSQISAMEPLIAYWIDEKKWVRGKAVIFCGLGSFLLGIPSALSFGIWQKYRIGGETFFALISNLSINVLIPLGGLAALVLAGWFVGTKETFLHLRIGTGYFYAKNPIVEKILHTSIKYLSPILILLILLHLLKAF
ncbi:MAG: sodium-dependent transporter [Verrucomicrobia bacterium]|nr:sodium-dependent transporter [Verrucomicrobiota bacterium]